MNINKIPVDSILRGTIVSIMETDRPFIETFNVEGEIISIAYIAGLPIPFNTLIQFMAMRFAPNTSKSMMPSRYSQGTVFEMTKVERRRLTSFWKNVEMSPEVRALTKDDREQMPSIVISKKVEELFQKYINYETVEPFKELIRRIDEDYGSSLLDPIQV